MQLKAICHCQEPKDPMIEVRRKPAKPAHLCRHVIPSTIHNDPPVMEQAIGVGKPAPDHAPARGPRSSAKWQTRPR